MGLPYDDCFDVGREATTERHQSKQDLLGQLRFKKRRRIDMSHEPGIAQALKANTFAFRRREEAGIRRLQALADNSLEGLLESGQT